MLTSTRPLVSHPIPRDNCVLCRRALYKFEDLLLCTSMSNDDSIDSVLFLYFKVVCVMGLIIGVVWNLKRFLTMVTIHILFVIDVMTVWQQQQQRQQTDRTIRRIEQVLKSNHRIHPKLIIEILFTFQQNRIRLQQKKTMLFIQFNILRRNNKNHRFEFNPMDNVYQRDKVKRKTSFFFLFADSTEQKSMCLENHWTYFILS